MAMYEYTARDETGHIFSGVYDNVNGTSALRHELAKIGYNLLRAKRKRALKLGSTKIKLQEVVAFAYKLAGMCSAGLSIIQCLETLEKQTDNWSLKFIITDIRKNVEIGSSLTDAFGKYRDTFSPFFLGMIEAGESSGKLAESLEISARYLEKQAEIRNRLKSAFTYPIVVLVMCMVVVTALILFVVPVFSKIYRQLGVPLPGPTQTLIVLSIILKRFWPILITVMFCLPFCIRYICKNTYIKTKWDYFKFSIPLFGNLNKTISVSHFIRSFAMLIVTGDRKSTRLNSSHH
jgi:type IV pilus assembly protein PilC